MLHVLLLTVTPILKDRQLVLVGDDAPDVVVIADYEVRLDGHAPILFSEFDRLTIDLRGGDDEVHVRDRPSPMDVYLGDGADTFIAADVVLPQLELDTGAGSDFVAFFDNLLRDTSIRTGTGDDYVLMYWSFTGGSLWIDLGAGDDSFEVVHGGVETDDGPVSIRGGLGIDRYLQFDSPGEPKLSGFELPRVPRAPR